MRLSARFLVRSLRKYRICSCISRKNFCQLLTLKVRVRLAHALRGNVFVACASTYTRGYICATHVLVAMLRGSVFCGLRKHMHTRAHSRGFANFCHYHVGV